MYVKVTKGRGQGVPPGDFLCEVSQPVHSGTATVGIPQEAKWREDGTLLWPGNIDYSAALGVDLATVHQLEMSCGPTPNGNQPGTLVFRYAYWADPATGLTAVVSTRNIFIIGANGKTVDRVS